ncbi:3-hydroxyacyl-CoA dehydrogenase NAD-binding domain-containing protein [Azospirillum sp. B4]|uniref:3-hydroxyacyl-CoA dehydrogenase NAD-binding domain-containing protein n=1 Tax=Azospirillum sp. B4 TaxID=95605 RepID=UPI0003478C7F|nr:3-hydroxyacyl-CoA dehydrogenase NAD-binding domain-containing protein [Azospirillum sp. B4]
MTRINEAISIRVDGDIGVILANHPPVNALSHIVREGLVHAVEALCADAAVKAIVLACEGRTFFAGADITEFGKPKREPSLQQAIKALETAPKPIVAAIHGTALGGGFEVALGCHFRVMVPTAKVGLPEITLGLFAGAGGTQRLPRLIGPERALDYVLSGKPVSAAEAVAAGIVDAVIDDAPLAAGMRHARAIIDQKQSAVPVRDRTAKLAAAQADPAAFEAKAKALAPKAFGPLAAAANIASVRRSFTLPLDEALAEDAKANAELMAGPQSRALRHLFFAEREAAKLPHLPADTRPREIARVAVVGAGTMGGGIAMSFAAAGLPVVLIDATRDALDRGMDRIRANYASSVKRGSLSEARRNEQLALIQGTTDRKAAADVDLVVEAVFENMDVKVEIFRDLGALTQPGTILSSNTSALDVDAIAVASGRPQDFVGLHFFAPANVMKLLEVVKAAASSPETIATAMAVGRRIGKVPVLSGNCDGFIGNRILAKRSAAVERLLQQGALPQDIDRAMRGFGFPMGPLEINDMSGLDVGWSIRKRRGTPFPIADAICERGWFGQKTGRGYYLYEPGGRTPLPNPEVEALILDTSARLGIQRRPLSDEEIVDRALYPLINEAARVVVDGIALRPSDVDVTFANGFGWPRWRGGPLFHADLVGLPKVVERLTAFRADTDDPSLEPAPLLHELAAAGTTFAEWQKART